jgi:hypothetical protein
MSYLSILAVAPLAVLGLLLVRLRRLGHELSSLNRLLARVGDLSDR